MESARAPLARALQPWLTLVLALSVAIGTGVLLAEVLMSPVTAQHFRLLSKPTDILSCSLIVALICLCIFFSKHGPFR